MLKDKIEIANCTKSAEVIHTITEWDFVLFLEPSAAFVQDGTRNETISQIKDLLEKYRVKYCIIDGDNLDRFVKVKELIGKHLKIDTKW